jgi:orotidine-5'-phosphate decarboxylase
LAELTPHFADRLSQQIARQGTPLVACLDPRLAQLPESLRAGVRENDYAAVAAAFQKFCCEIIDVVAPLVPAVKPQAAFFEMTGPAGMTALSRIIDYAMSRDLMVLLDGKRNDIGSTATAYARGWLGRKPASAWGCDALTINPYMGDDSLQPFVDRGLETGSGLFVLVKTSNPGSNTFQELPTGNRKLYQEVAAWVQTTAAATAGQCGYGVVGAVVGATHPAHLAELREAMPNTFFLIPGFGAQGGKAIDLVSAFDEHGGGAIVNSSRGIIFAWEQPRYGETSSWQASVDAATRNAMAEIADVLPASPTRPANA